MDADSVELPAADPAEETSALLRRLTDRRLTPTQSADLDAVLDQLEALVQAPEDDAAVLLTANGDLRIIELTAAEDGAALSRTQRDRIKRLIGQLSPHSRRQMRRRWR